MQKKPLLFTPPAYRQEALQISRPGTFQVAADPWDKKSAEFSCRELTENILRLLTYAVEARGCTLEFIPPNPSALLLSIMLPVFTWEEPSEDPAPTPNQTILRHFTDRLICDRQFGQIARLRFLNPQPYMMEKQSAILELADSFLAQLYKILFLQEDSNSLETAYLKILFQISDRLDNHKLNMRSHSSHTASLTKLIALELGCPSDQSQLLYFTGLFHDIGKIIIPETILHKTGPLDSREWKIIQNHAAFGASLFAPLDDLQPIIPIIRGHHEWVDGSGYPDRLHGEEIPLGSRIIAVADAYSTMIDGRIYRKRRNPKQAREELKSYRGTQFDPLIVDVFLGLLAP